MSTDKLRVIHAEDIESTFKISVVVSRFNQQITDKLLEGTIDRLHELNFSDELITVAWVPGAVELPLVAQQFAKQSDIAAVICLGAVIRGETTHYDYVCEQASQGCQRVALDYEKPVIFGVLTTEDLAQALDRVGGKHGHRGRESADGAYEMVSVLKQINA